MTCTGNPGAFEGRIDRVAMRDDAGQLQVRAATDADRAEFRSVEVSLGRAANAAAKAGAECFHVFVDIDGERFAFDVAGDSVCRSLIERCVTVDLVTETLAKMNTTSTDITVFRDAIRDQPGLDRETSTTVQFLHEGIHHTREQQDALQGRLIPRSHPEYTNAAWRMLRGAEGW